MPNKILKILFYDRKTKEKNWGTERTKLCEAIVHLCFIKIFPLFSFFPFLVFSFPGFFFNFHISSFILLYFFLFFNSLMRSSKYKLSRYNTLYLIH